MATDDFDGQVAFVTGAGRGQGRSHNTAAKHGPVGLTTALALELAEHGANGNAVAPIGIATAMIDGMLEPVGKDAFASVSDASGVMNVMDGQLLDPVDVSEAYTWLSSDAARAVTGVTLPVDAGMLAA